MKISLSILFVLFIYNLQSLQSSELVFSPENPVQGDTVNIKYSGNKRFESKSKLDLLIYSFDSKSIHPEGFETILTKEGDFWTGKLIIPENSVYLMMKIFAAGNYIDMIDNNNGLYWEILVSKDNRHVRDANLKAALGRLGSISSNIDRLPDYHFAIKHLENEINLYPDNLSAELGLLTTLFDMKKINSDEFGKKLNEIASRKIDENDENSVRTKARALYANNEKEGAAKLESNFASKFPQSDIAEDILIAEISKAASLLEFVKSCDKFFSRFPNSLNRERVFLAYISGYMQSNKIEELITSLDSIKNVPGYIYARIAKNLFSYYKSKDLLKDQNNRNLLITLIDKAEKISDEQIKSPSVGKPKIYTNGEWTDMLDIQSGTVKEIKAEIYKEIEPYRGLEYYKSALALLRDNASEALYENYIELLIALGDSAKAIEMAEDAIIKGKISEKITDFHRDASRTVLSMNDSLYNIKADSIYAQSKKIKQEIYLNEILQQTEYQYALETLENTFVDFRDLKGKVAVFSFFASWCDPCKTMFPAFQELYILYKNNPDVEIVAVNTLENEKLSKDDLKRFVVKNDIAFPVARDVMDIMPRQMGINGIPTIAILDKKSRVRFLVKGFSNNEKMLDDISGRIEFLLTLDDK